MAVNRTNGKQVADPTKFPSGMAALAKYVHGQGLKFVRRLSPCSRLSPLSCLISSLLTSSLLSSLLSPLAS